MHNPLYVVEEHRTEANQEATRTEDLHRTDEVQATIEVVDLSKRCTLRVRIAFILLLQVAHNSGIGEEAIGVGQKNQRDGREE